VLSTHLTGKKKKSRKQVLKNIFALTFLINKFSKGFALVKFKKFTLLNSSSNHFIQQTEFFLNFTIDGKKKQKK